MKTFEERFAVNLRRLRTDAKMTQEQLAQALGYSEKTISKWECAAGIPGVPTLYRLTELLHVGIDQLFQEDKIYLLGIDGGGTKTALAITDEKMNIIRQLRADCCNPMDIGIDATKTTLRQAIHRVCEGIPFSSIVCFAGIAGGTSGDMKARLHDFFEEFGFAAFENDSDNRNIICAGLGKEDGIAVIMGTGVCAFSQHNGVQKRIGGWGYLFDDGGSAYNLGRDALAAHFRYVDGSGEYTLLSRLITKDHPDPQILLGKLYAGGKKLIATFAPYIYQAIEKNDTVAASILARNMACAAKIIQAAALVFPQSRIPVVLAGGLTGQDRTIEGLKSALHNDERYDIHVLSCEPLLGAVQLAKELFEQRKERLS